MGYLRNGGYDLGHADHHWPSGRSLPGAFSTLLAAGIPIVEHLTGLGQLPPRGARFTAAPPAAGPIRHLSCPRLRCRVTTLVDHHSHICHAFGHKWAVESRYFANRYSSVIAVVDHEGHYAYVDDYGVLYFGSTLQACFAETLARCPSGHQVVGARGRGVASSGVHGRRRRRG